MSNESRPPGEFDDAEKYRENLRDQILNLEKDLNHSRSDHQRTINNLHASTMDLQTARAEIAFLKHVKEIDDLAIQARDVLIERCERALELMNKKAQSIGSRFNPIATIGREILAEIEKMK